MALDNFDEFGNYIGGANKGGIYSPKISQGFNRYLQGYPIQTIGDYTGYDTGSAPMQPLPTLPQTYAPTPGNPNWPTIPPIPSPFSLSGTSMKPGYEDFMQGATLPNQDEMPSGGKIVKTVTNAAAKLNPYLAAGTAILGGAQALVGALGLGLSKRPEGYKEVPEMTKAIGEAEQAAQYGLGAQQLALAKQQGREAINTQLYNARNLSPNMAGILARMNVGSSLMAANQLAAQDFAAQQQKVGIRNQLYGTRQRLADANVQLAQQNYARQQEAYGGAMRSGLTNLGSFFNLNQALKYNPSIT